MVSRANILVVEDNDDLREMLAMLLESEGHAVTGAANGQLALEALASGPGFGMITLDLMMPVMDGARFLELKARTVHAAIPVVIFSASPYRWLDNRAGVSSVVHKDSGPETLLAAIDKAIGAPPPPARSG